jgi:hypothetical protein
MPGRLRLQWLVSHGAESVCPKNFPEPEFISVYFGGLDPEIGAAAVRHAHAATPTAETTPRLSV